MASSAVAAVRSRHRVVIPLLYTLAVLVGFVACFAVWINRQALNTDNWTNTSSQLLANQQIDDALSAYAVNELFRSVNVTEKVKSELPTQIQGIAGPASAGLRVLAERAVPKLLATAQVQEAWRNSNRAAHAELLRILGGGSKTVSTNGGVVSLNLHELIAQLANQLGLGSQFAAAQAKLQGSTGAQARSAAEQKLGITLPPTTGQLVIMRSNELRTAQNIAQGIRGLAIVLPIICFALFALAIWLDAGRRRLALRTTGWCLFGIGVLLLVARRVAGDGVVNGLVAIPANRPAAHAAWSIGTSLLYDIALAMLAYGLVLVAAAWLAGKTRPAQFLRRTLAPWLREHALGSYAAAAAALLLIVLWGPTPATRQVIPIIGFAILAALGVRALRNQTGLEFPDAQPGEAAAAVRHWVAGARGHHGHNQAAASEAAAGVPSAANASAPNGSRIQALQELAALHERGALTDEEFAAEKRRVIHTS